MNKNVIGKRILQDKEKIIARYKADDDIQNMAEDYNVRGDTLCHKLHSWGIKIRKGDYQKQGKLDQTKKVKYTLKKSPELLAKIKKNTEINNKYIKFYNTVDTGKDNFLVQNIFKNEGD